MKETTVTSYDFIISEEQHKDVISVIKNRISRKIWLKIIKGSVLWAAANIILTITIAYGHSVGALTDIPAVTYQTIPSVVCAVIFTYYLLRHIQDARIVKENIERLLSGVFGNYNMPSSEQEFLDICKKYFVDKDDERKRYEKVFNIFMLAAYKPKTVTLISRDDDSNDITVQYETPCCIIRTFDMPPLALFQFCKRSFNQEGPKTLTYQDICK